MKLWAYVLAILAVFSSGWMAHSAHINKEMLNEAQKSEKRYNDLRESQAKERDKLEAQRLKDNQTAAKRLQLALNENARLREDAIRPVDISFLVYARLCESPDDCAVFYRTTQADGTTQALPAPTSLDIYSTLRDVSDAIDKYNLQVEQINKQIKDCHK